jgi:hypothetical protein
MLRHLLLPILVAGALAWAGSTDAQTGGVPDLELFTVGTGDVGGGYYSAGRAICEAVNRERTGQLRCSPEPTPGSQSCATARSSLPWCSPTGSVPRLRAQAVLPRSGRCPSCAA